MGRKKTEAAEAAEVEETGGPEGVPEESPDGEVKQEKKKDVEPVFDFPEIASLDELLDIDDTIYEDFQCLHWRKKICLRTLTLGEMSIIKKYPDRSDQSLLMFAYAWVNKKTKKRVIGYGASPEAMLEECRALRAKNGAQIDEICNKINSMHRFTKKQRQEIAESLS